MISLALVVVHALGLELAGDGLPPINIHAHVLGWILVIEECLDPSWNEH